MTDPVHTHFHGPHVGVDLRGRHAHTHAEGDAATAHAHSNLEDPPILPPQENTLGVDKKGGSHTRAYDAGTGSRGRGRSVWQK